MDPETLIIKRTKTMRLLTYLSLILIFAIGVSFACLNALPVTVNYYFGTDAMPLSLLLFLALFLGVMLGVLAAGSVWLKLSWRHHRLKSELKLAKTEIQNLRVIQ